MVFLNFIFKNPNSQEEKYILCNPSLKRGNIYCPEKDVSENLRTRIKLISLWVGLIVIIVIGLLIDRLRGLTFRGQFKVTALRFSTTSLSGPSHD